MILEIKIFSMSPSLTKFTFTSAAGAARVGVASACEESISQSLGSRLENNQPPCPSDPFSTTLRSNMIPPCVFRYRPRPKPQPQCRPRPRRAPNPNLRPDADDFSTRLTATTNLHLNDFSCHIAFSIGPFTETCFHFQRKTVSNICLSHSTSKEI